MQQRYGWKERLADSSWVTVCWDWFMTLVGRVVEAVLWVTMAFSCYQLIPAVPQAPAGVSACAFIAQFLALDAGGLGLSKLAEQQGLGTWAYARVVSYVLIGITLVTVAYAGVTHAVQVDASLTKWVEVSLVTARSIMTVLYGQAMQSLRAAKQAHTNQVTSLQEELHRAQQQVSSGQAEVSRLRAHLDTKAKEADGLRGQVSSGQGEVSTLRMQLDALRGQVDSGQAEVDTLRRQLQSAVAQVEKVRAEIREKQHEPEGGQRAVDAEPHQVSSGQAYMDSGHLVHPVSKVRVQMDSGQVIPLDRKKRERGQQEAEQVLGEHIKALLSQEPELSNRAIATKLACSPTTVGKWRKSLASASMNEQASFAHRGRKSRC
ncbi:MAG: hypothetical protein JO202_19430 [Ktedonobacteraceae bacterium]|nr:hypothetical protein [Ktedonobacteraceae bacterium]